MEISSLNPISPRPEVITRNGAARQTLDSSRIARPGDQVEISDRAALLSRLRELPEMRHGLIDQVRAAIERGEYDSPEKLDTAIEKMVADQPDEF